MSILTLFPRLHPEPPSDVPCVPLCVYTSGLPASQFVEECSSVSCVSVVNNKECSSVSCGLVVNNKECSSVSCGLVVNNKECSSVSCGLVVNNKECSSVSCGLLTFAFLSSKAVCTMT